MTEFSDIDVHRSDALVIYNGAMSDNQIIGYFTDLDGDRTTSEYHQPRASNRISLGE